jgi:hypothetical protein
MTVRTGCCRRARARAVPGGSKICTWFEQLGTNQIVWPINSTSGLKVVIKITNSGQTKKFELFSFLDGNKCSGVVARWVQGQRDSILAAAQANPQKFAQYAGSGIKLNELVTLCRKSK